jgi:hypothetical protein
MDFDGESLGKLKTAAGELSFLLSRGYPIKTAVSFIGNHYLFTERQRQALLRVSSAPDAIKLRRSKEIPADGMSGRIVNIDGFNTIITLETALSGSPVFLSADGTYRDLAGLRGTYRLIDKTDIALRLIMERLKELGAAGINIYLDEPVANSGRLKTRIAEIAEELSCQINIEITGGVDRTLKGLAGVVTSDSIILDHCVSWFNLNGLIIPEIRDAWIIKLLD